MAGERSTSPRASRRDPGLGGSVVRLAVVLLGVAAGCGAEPSPRPVRPEFDLHHPSGTIRLHAIAQVAARRETSQVPALIERLDDEDPAVRLQAAAALREITGHDTGYEAYFSPAERQRHVGLWRAWWAARSRAAPVPATRPPTPVPPPSRPPPPSPATPVAPLSR
jgi:HEAT repeat protein